MTPPEDPARKDAVNGLLRIAMWEGVVLVAVVASYFATGKIWVLLAGVAASMALFTPMFMTWVREHSAALRSKPNSIGDGDG